MRAWLRAAGLAAAFGLLTAQSNNPASPTSLGLATIATSGSASDLSTGTVPVARLPILPAVATSALTKNLDTALANIPGMSVSLLAGKTYLCWGVLYTSAGASGGIKFALSNGDTLTVTSIAYGALLGSGGQSTTTLGVGIGATSAAVFTYFGGTVVVSVAGTLVVQGAQNASNGVNTVFQTNSSVACAQQA